VTAFPAPLNLAPVDDALYEDHLGAKEVIAKKPELCSSHTVLVVDTSGSMKTHDIILHRDRQVAAYSTLALEYVAEQLFQETANNRDVVSLIEFNKTGR
jgi:Mg-chelatase subunit ChlD